MESAWLFRHILRQRKAAKTPEVDHALPIRMLPDRTGPATAYAASRQGADAGLARWTCGTAAARSGCMTAAVSAVAALTVMGRAAAARQRLRERALDGADRARPSPNQIDARACFVPLMGRVLSMWKSDGLALAYRSREEDAAALSGA